MFFPRMWNSVEGISVANSYWKPLIFVILKTKVEFKNINFVYLYLNDPFGNNFCLEKGSFLKIKNQIFLFVFKKKI
jgi:hypothetical protein